MFTLVLLVGAAANAATPYSDIAGLTPLSLSQQMSGVVVDMSQKIEALNKDIRDAKMEAKNNAAGMAVEINKELEPIDTLQQEANANDGKSKTESETVTTAVGQMANAATAALNGAKSNLAQQVLGAQKQNNLLQEVNYASTGTAEQIRMATGMTLEGDKATFEGLYNSAVNFADGETMKFEGRLAKATMRRDTSISKLGNAVERFKKDEEKWAKNSKDMLKESKASVKDMGKDMKKFSKTIAKDMGAAHKLINKVGPIIPKATSTKSFEKYLGKQDKAIVKDMAKVVKEMDKSIEKTLKTTGKNYQVLTKKVNTAKGDILKQLNELEAQDSADTDQWSEQSKQLGKDMKSLAKEIKKTTGNVDKDGRDVRFEITNSEREMKQQIKELSEKVTKDADERVPESQAEIDSSSAQANAMIGQSTTDLSGAIAESTDELDQKVQAQSMSLTGPLADAQAQVNKDKTIAASLQTAAVAQGAEVESDKTQAETILKDSLDEAKKAQFQMGLGLQGLAQHLQAGDNKYKLLGDSEMEKLVWLLDNAVSGIAAPVQQKLSKTIRTVNDHLQSEKITQGEDLGEVENQLKEIEAKLAQNNNDNSFIKETVPKLIDGTELKLRQLTNGLDKLEHGRVMMNKNVEGRVKLEVQNSLTKVREQLGEIRQDTLDKQNKQNTPYNDLLSKIRAAVMEWKNRGVMDNQALKDGQTDLKAKLTNLEESLTENEEIQNGKVSQANKMVDEITGTKIAELSNIGSTATTEASDKIKRAMDRERAREAQELADSENKVIGEVDGEASKATQKLVSDAAALDQASAAGMDHLQEQLSLAQEKATDMSTKATTSKNAFQGAVDAIQRGSAQTAEAATRDQDELAQQQKSLVANLAHLKESSLEETEDSIKSADAGIKSTRERQTSILNAEISDARKKTASAAASWNGEMDGALQDVRVAQENTGNAKRQAEASQENAMTTFEQAEADVGGKVEKMTLQQHGAEEEARDKADGIAKQNEATGKRTGAILGTLGGNAEDDASKQDAKTGELVNKVEAKVKTIYTEEQAAIAGVESGIQQANTAQARDESDIQQAEFELWDAAHRLDAHREEYENKTAIKMNTFQELVQAERDSLAENREYLDKYERYTHWQQLNLLELAIELIKTEVGGADTVFDRMEKKEEEFADDVSHMMNGEEFQTLKKIFDADKFVQKATREDEDMVKNLEDHETRSLPWMQKVLLALDAAHDEIELKEKEEGAEQHENDEEAAKRTGSTLDKLAKMVEVDGGEGEGNPLEELGAMTAGAVKDMDKNQKSASDNEQANINALQSEANDQAKGTNAQVDEAKHKFSQIKSAIGDTGGAVDQLQEVVDSVTKQREKEIAAMKEATNGKLNALLAKTLGGDEEDAAGEESLLQAASKDSKLGSLLQQNEKLRNLNRGLDRKHAELGKQVQQVSSLMQQLRQNEK